MFSVVTLKNECIKRKFVVLQTHASLRPFYEYIFLLCMEWSFFLSIALLFYGSEVVGNVEIDLDMCELISMKCTASEGLHFF